MTPCDYCYDGKCKGKLECDEKHTAWKLLKPTIRITTKCTQSCDHCCFSCSPDRNDMMTVEQARKVAEFLHKYDILYANVMGGEFFCNPDWKEIMSLLLKEIKMMRIVTNGDWVTRDDVKEGIKEFVNQDKSKTIFFCVSADRWHNGKNIESAVTWLKENNIQGEAGKMEERAVVPIGRGFLYSTFFSSLGCYCRHKDQRYSFLINENGDVYKCPFGLYRIFNVGMTDKNFFEKFKKFNSALYDIFIPSCVTCYNFSRK